MNYDNLAEWSTPDEPPHGASRRIPPAAPARAVANGREDFFLEAAGAGTWEWDIEANRVRWSPRLEAMFGVPPGSLDGTAIEAFVEAVHPEDREQVLQALELAVQGGSTDYQAEYRIEVGNTIRWIQDNGRVYHDSAGRAHHMAGICLDITRRKSVEQQLAERTAEAEARARQLQRLALEVARAEQHERAKLARILHDGLQQILVSAKMHTQRLRRCTPADVPEWADRVTERLDEAIDETRKLSYDLTPPILTAKGLGAALQWLAARTHERYGFTVHLEVDPNAEPASNEGRMLLFQAVRELLLNVVKHGATEEAWVRMRVAERGWVQVSVKDHGCGFDVQRLAPETAGLGLLSMQEHFDALGGMLTLDSAPGRGTTVAISMPISPKA